MTLTLVAIADTHTFHDDLDVPDGDILIHAGDMARHGTLDELAAARDFLAALPHRHKIVVAGNHDRAFETRPQQARQLFEDFIYLEDEAYSLAGLTFYGSPWTPAFGDWSFSLPRGKLLAEKWALIPEDTDVLITHGPPRGIGDHAGALTGREGCENLLNRVQAVAPKVHIFGHIHNDPGSWRIGPTLFVNATTDECMRPATVIRYPPDSVE